MTLVIVLVCAVFVFALPLSIVTIIELSETRRVMNKAVAAINSINSRGPCSDHLLRRLNESVAREMELRRDLAKYKVEDNEGPSLAE